MDKNWLKLDQVYWAWLIKWVKRKKSSWLKIEKNSSFFSGRFPWVTQLICENQTQLDLKYQKLLWVGVSEFPQSGGALKLQTLTLMIQVWVCFGCGSGLAFRNMHKCAHHKFTLFWFETFKRILTGQYFMPFSTQLNWFKVKPSILVLNILNTESRKTSSPTLPSSAPWDGGRFAWLCSETKIREGAEHQRKVSHPT